MKMANVKAGRIVLSKDGIPSDDRVFDALAI